jgi:hypothetical protein
MSDDNDKAFRQSMAFNAEAARAGLFASAMDIAEMMKKNDIPHGEAALVTGAVEFAVQLWMQVMLKAGNTRQAARQQLEKEVRVFARKHSHPERQQEARPS